MLAQCCMINLPGRRFIGTWEFVVRAPTTILQLLHSAITRATSSIRCCPSASQNSTKSRVEARTPDLNAAPYPRLESWFMTSAPARSEEHTSELQSLTNLVCRLLLEKKKKKTE